MKRDFLKIRDLSPEELRTLLTEAVRIKANPSEFFDRIKAKGMLLLFEKTSTRTALSYQAAMGQLGGYSVLMDWGRSNFSISPIRYETQYASRNSDLIMARLKSHADLKVLAESSVVPVINGCDDRYHPSQALADFMTIFELSHSFDSSLAYVGVRNNVSNCLVEGCLALGIPLTLITPLENQGAVDEELDSLARASGLVTWSSDVSAAEDAAFVYTDTWIDMENFANPQYAEERQRRVALMTPYQVNTRNFPNPNQRIMHDMPIHPGFEISEDMIECDRSVIYQQAENRMHVQKALILWLLGLL